MSATLYKSKYSVKVLFQLFSVIGILAVLVTIHADFLRGLYVSNRMTIVGQAVNGSIFVLLVFGLIQIVFLLFRYNKEERSLKHFYENIQENVKDPLHDVHPQSLISRRYQELRDLNRTNSPIDHGALSAILVAEQSILVSIPKFINNILILIGVLGTVLSLAIALTGSSNLLESLTNTDGMSQIVYGMSTALSTTISAIVAYLLFGYFFTKLTDVQTYILQTIEKFTSLYLVPKFDLKESGLILRLAKVTEDLSGLTDQMKEAQSLISEQNQKLAEIASSSSKDISTLADRVQMINHSLIKGFRLIGDNNND